MTVIDPQLAIDVLTANPQDLGATDAERTAYIEEVKARLQPPRTQEDHREAAKLSVETAKMFLTISVGVLVATFAWMQFAHSNAGVSWISLAIVPFYAAAVLMIFSMISGFVAISRIYKRADGREGANQPAWGTEPVVGVLNSQSRAGVLALLALFVGVLALGLHDQAPKEAVTINIPGKSGPTPNGSLTIEGTWTDLRLKTAANQEIKLPQQSVPVTITCQ
jgi:hypothetical protein